MNEYINTTIAIGDVIRAIQIYDKQAMIVYMVLITLAIIVIILKARNKKDRYKTWRKETLNLGVYKYEVTKEHDEFMSELFDENVRLTNEIKRLNTIVSKVSILALGLLLIWKLNDMLKIKN